MMVCCCANQNCRHRNKRKLRPLVISLIPQNDRSPSTTDGGGGSRHERITRMFTTPSLASHFDPPTFSPGIPSRELRNRLTFLEHCNSVGLIPEVEWEAITKAVNEQTVGHIIDVNQKDNICPKISEIVVESKSDCGDDEKHKFIDPFRYIAIETLISPCEDACEEKSKRKKKHWLEYHTTSLVPISPQRQGTAEDIALPYSMEIWRKAKTLNRDRSVLACSLAHLLAMKTLVGESGDSTLDGSDGDGGFDFILEDNVRAFAGISDDGECPEEISSSGWSCECANRIWDIIEASNEAPVDCHMRYYGWLGSLPNMTWIYNNHMPRSSFNKTTMQYDDSYKCAIFPFPTNEDFMLDSIIATAESKEGDLEQADPSSDGRSTKSSSAPHFITPGGTAAVWGTFAYTISPSAYRTLINRLQNDVGSLMWKGKRMRAYKAKPIDKLVPRHVMAEFGPTSVHVSNKVAFVRCPMLGSLLHQHWEAGFCSSTELQYHLSRGGESVNSFTPPNPVDGSDVWNHIWLEKEERQIVHHRMKSGHWVHKGDVEQMVKEDARRCVVGRRLERLPVRLRHRRQNIKSYKMSVSESGQVRAKIDLLGTFKPPPKSSKLIKAISLAVIVFVQSSVSISAFSFKTPVHNWLKRSDCMLMTSPDDGTYVQRERRRGKIGRVPIISRTISIDVKIPTEFPGKQDLSARVYSGRDETKRLDEIKRLDVTVWEMDKPSDLIQEWWSIDESERSARVGDPFGVVMWPGSILAAKELMKLHHSPPFKSPIVNSTVLVLGAGTGVEAQTAALLGAKRVIATDINPLTLKLLEYGANDDQRIGDTFEGRFFDIFSDLPLPAADVIIAADVLYNPELAKQVGRRLHEAIVRSFDAGASPTKVIITDSQRFHGTDFLEEVFELRELNAMFKEGNYELLRWETQKLESVCGSGVLIDEDQTYDVDVRMISWGW